MTIFGHTNKPSFTRTLNTKMQKAIVRFLLLLMMALVNFGSAQRIEILHHGNIISEERLRKNYEKQSIGALTSDNDSSKEAENIGWKELQLKVETVDGRQFLLQVKENVDLLKDLSKNTHGIYSGRVIGSDNLDVGWASIVFKGIDGKISKQGPTLEYEGSFSLSNQAYRISSLSMVESLTEGNEGNCGNTHDMDKELETFIHRKPFHYHQSEFSEDEESGYRKGGVTGKKEVTCLEERMVLPVAVACDCHFTKEHGGVDKTVAHVVSLFAQVSAAYEKHFNLFLGLVEIKAMAECDDGVTGAKWNRPCSLFYDMHKRLSDFSEWQAEAFRASNPGITHLLTACESKPLIGLSWIGMMCVRRATKTQKGNWIAGASVSSTNSLNIAQVIIHETGHVLGAGHDCDDQCECDAPSGCRDCCPCSRRERLKDKAIYSDLKHVMDSKHRCSCNSMYIMNPTTEMHSSEFSPCTRRELCTNLRLYGGLCLKRPEETKVISGRVCGNGIKEEGEECDCGTPEECANDPCCQVGCKLKRHAKCSDKNDKCCRDCKIIAKEEKIKCRKAIGPCDLEEYCNGTSASCPADRFQPDGLKCGSRGRRCASGHCTSRAEQCRTSGRRFQAIGECPKKRGSASCIMTCEVGPEEQCLTLTSHFVNGTPCGNGGFCRDGACEGSGIPPGHRLLLMIGVCLTSVALACLIVGILYVRHQKILLQQ